MTLRNCPREKEVRELMDRGRWPQASAPELCSHVDACRACADLVLVAGAFERAREETMAVAKPGSAGAIWWRAQLRRRRDAVERIEKPLVSAQIFALAVNLVVALGFVGFEARHGIAWLNWLQQSAASNIERLWLSGLSGSGWSWMVLGSAATFVLLGAVVAYIAAERN
jgi:hypothetical protein